MCYYYGVDVLKIVVIFLVQTKHAQCIGELWYARTQHKVIAKLNVAKKERARERESEKDMQLHGKTRKRSLIGWSTSRVRYTTRRQCNLAFCTRWIWIRGHKTHRGNSREWFSFGSMKGIFLYMRKTYENILSVSVRVYVEWNEKKTARISTREVHQPNQTKPSTPSQSTTKGSSSNTTKRGEHTHTHTEEANWLWENCSISYMVCSISTMEMRLENEAPK